MQVEVLLDTGAISGDYVNEATADWLVANGAKTCSCNKLICSVFGTECKRVTSKVVCDIVLTDNETKRS
jgi:3-keto-L-gulonate-6-phosphate decarboxylase